MPLVERRYAEALVDIAEKNGLIDEFQNEFETIVQIIETHEELRLFLTSPVVKLDTKKEVTKNIFSGKVKEEMVNFLLLLIDKDRMVFLSGIFFEYVKLADKRKNILNIKIISALPLDETQVDRIKEKYKASLGAASVKVETEVDKNLIGGIKVIMGDKVIDGTVAGRLQSLKEFIVK